MAGWIGLKEAASSDKFERLQGAVPMDYPFIRIKSLKESSLSFLDIN